MGSLGSAGALYSGDLAGAGLFTADIRWCDWSHLPARVCSASHFVAPGCVPSRVIRREMADAAPLRRWSYASGVVGTLCLMMWYSGDVTLTLLILSGVVAIGGVWRWWGYCS